jgi:hypothetical protein
MADAISTKLPRSAPAPRHAIDRVAAKIEPRLAALFRRLPAGVSLFTGGVFILATIFLPLAIDGCGDYAGTGKDIVLGKLDTYWPSFTGSVPYFGRGFYIFLLAWGAVAVVAALARLLGRDLLRSRIWLPVVLAGALSCFVMADTMVWPVIDLAYHLPDGLLWVLLLPVGLAPYRFFRTARAPSVRASRCLRRVFLLGSVLFALTIAGWAVMVITDAEPFDSPHLALCVAGYLLFFLPPALCLFGPLALWFRHGVWPMEDSALYWPSLRRRLVLTSAPLVAGQLWVAYMPTQIPHAAWGLIPCLAGIHLITLGYLRLARSAKLALQLPVFSSQLSVVSPRLRSITTHNS